MPLPLNFSFCASNILYGVFFFSDASSDSIGLSLSHLSTPLISIESPNPLPSFIEYLILCASHRCHTTETSVITEGEAIALYSASEEDRDTVLCFFDFHEIGEFPSRRIYPVTDLLVLGHEAQSESEKTCKVRREEALSLIP